MSFQDVVNRVLSVAEPDDVWRLHPYLLDWDMPQAEPARELARSFYGYLCAVRSKLTSKQYSGLAAALAAGSVGVIAAKDVVEAFRQNPEQALGHLLAGGLAETLEVLSTTQHVRAWATEFRSVHDDAVWDLYAALWRLSAALRPDLPVETRDELIQRLLAPARNPDAASAVRTAVIIRLYQILLAIHLAPLLDARLTLESGA